MAARGPSRCGFTLIELMVVIAIIGLLMAALVTVSVDMIRSAKIKGTQALMGQVMSALHSYQNEFWYYPTGDTYSATATSSGTGSLYILWKGGGPRLEPPPPAVGVLVWDVAGAQVPGEIKGPQGKRLRFLEEGKDVSAFTDSAKEKPADKWGKEIVYGVWRPALATSPIDPYAVLTSAGPDGIYGPGAGGIVDDIVVKGRD